MDNSASYEYVVSPKKQSKWKLRRLLALCGYVIYAVGMFIIGAATPLFVYMLGFVPLSTWIIVWLTWRYVTPEFEYSITGGTMTIAVIYGGRTRKKLAEIRIRSMIEVMPLEGEYVKVSEDFAPEQILDITSSRSAPDVYFALYNTEDGKKAILYFEATTHALKMLRSYHSATVIRQVSK